MSPAATPTSGSAFEPMESGRGVDYGVRRKKKQEKRMLKKQ